MQAKNLTGGQELLCINTEKVYDWVINEASFTLDLVDVALGGATTCADIDLDTLTCEVTPTTGEGGEPAPFEVLNRETQEFVIDGEVVMLQLVTIRKNFNVTLVVDPVANGGTPIEIDAGTFSRCEQVILCAPEDTVIDVTYTDLDCFVCSATCDGTDTTLDASINIRLCQSIQSTFDVTLEIVADFCEPRDLLEIPPCPAPTRPLQCPVVFPNGNNGDNG